MDIESILKEFVEQCLKELGLKTVIQFGSSTYSKNYDDVDFLFCSTYDVLPTGEILKLIRIIKDFEKRYDVVFDFGGINRKRDAAISITVIFIGEADLDVTHNPHDLFFFSNLSRDKNKKILHGKDLFKNKNFNLTNQHLFEMLSVDLKHALRKSLDDEEYRFSAIYRLFKTFLRGMLINHNVIKKGDLLSGFEKIYLDSIKLPSDSKRILRNDLRAEDFEEVLNFSEKCLNYLLK